MAGFLAESGFGKKQWRGRAIAIWIRPLPVPKFVSRDAKGSYERQPRPVWFDPRFSGNDSISMDRQGRKEMKETSRSVNFLAG
jgi:hypothetical protein